MHGLDGGSDGLVKFHAALCHGYGLDGLVYPLLQGVALLVAHNVAQALHDLLHKSLRLLQNHLLAGGLWYHLREKVAHQLRLLLLRGLGLAGSLLRYLLDGVLWCGMPYLALYALQEPV